MQSFAGSVVLVTGGATGIGQATARAFAQEGARVIIAGRRMQTGEEVVAGFKAEGYDASFIQADVTVEAEAARLLGQVVARYGRLDIAFNNAGYLATGAITELDEETWDRTMAINLKGTWLSMKYEIRQMLTQKSGTIVNMSSNIGEYVTRPAMSAYATAKAGVLALTRTAALEYIQAGIRVNAVSPGPIRTPLSRRAGESDEERDQRVRENHQGNEAVEAVSSPKRPFFSSPACFSEKIAHLEKKTNPLTHLTILRKLTIFVHRLPIMLSQTIEKEVRTSRSMSGGFVGSGGGETGWTAALRKDHFWPAVCLFHYTRAGDDGFHLFH